MINTFNIHLKMLINPICYSILLLEGFVFFKEIDQMLSLYTAFGIQSIANVF